MSLFKVTDTEEYEVTPEPSEGKVAQILNRFGIGKFMLLPEPAIPEIQFGKCLV